MDLPDPARGETLEGVRGDVGMLELVYRLRQDPAHVYGDVPLADDDSHFLTEIELAVPVVGVRVVPADELGRRVASRQVLAGDAQLPIALGPAAEQNGVVSRPQLLDAHVAAHGDVAEEPELGDAGDPVVDADRLLELGMVGGHTVAHQAEGSRQSLEHVDANHPSRFEQAFRGVEPARPGAHDGDPEGMLLRAGAHPIRTPGRLCAPPPPAAAPVSR